MSWRPPGILAVLLGLTGQVLLAGSHSLNREQSMWEMHRGWFLAAAAVLGLQLILIVALGRVHRHRKRGAALLKESQASLEQVVAERTAELRSNNELLKEDLVKRRNVESALQETYAELRLIFKNMINAFVVWESVFDESGQYVSFRFGLFNDAFGRISKLDYEDVRGKDVFEVWPDTEQSWVEAYGQVATSGTPSTFDMYHGPTMGWYHCNVYRPTDSPSKICVIFEDITESRRTEEKLREAERMALGTLDALSKHIAILDETGTLLAVNKAWRRFADENGGGPGSVCEGANYLQACASAMGPEAPEAVAFAEGIRGVMTGDMAEYCQEYACHSPGTQRWFLGKVTRFAGEGSLRVVVTHENITARKIAEKAMMEALAEADRFKGAMDHISAFVHIKDRQHRYVYANKPMRELLHCSAEELEGSDDSRFFPPETVARLWAVDGRVLEHGEDSAEEIVNQTASEGPRVFWEVKTPIFDEVHRGEIWGLCSIATDVTERKEVEAFLRETQERLKFALDGSNDGWWDVRMDTGAVSLSPRTCEILGYPPEDGDRIARIWSEMVHPDDLGSTHEALRTYLEGRVPLFSVEQRLRTAAGDWKWILVRGKSVAWNTEGAATRLVGTHTDISDRKRAEETIRAKTDLLDLTGRMAKVGGWEFDVSTMKGSWTEEVARIHDLESLPDFGVQGAFAFYTEETRPIIKQAVREAIERGKPYDLELELISAKGILKMVRTVGVPVKDENGKVVLVRGILQDITDKKIAEERIRAAQAETQRLLESADRSRLALLSLVEDQRAAEVEIWRLNADLERRVADRTLELEAANRELEAFAYSVSHDLRAPLRHMEGFLAMLGRHLGDRLDDKGSHYLKVAQGATVRMGQLVEGLLSFSRLGRAELRMVAVESSLVVSAVIDEFKGECADRNVRWEVGDLPVIQGDPTLLRLVFQNLIGNALKFTRNRPEAVIEIQPIEGLAGERGVSIRDNGAGFDPAYAHKLFGVFQRLHREDEFEGTGIGLANVHRIVSRHGGRVWAEGRLGEGAAFFVAFPAGQERL